MQMCDTFVVKRPGGVILAKNSDREPNEAQHLDWIPAREHAPGSLLHCTWARIPQVPHTHALVLSRPYWMWGAEMGANEHGLAIGNEAIFAHGELLPEGLTGMDLLRLALERARSAATAVDVIRELLAVHGQGGDAGYARTGFRYHNSFLIADREDAWLLESIGRESEAARITSAVFALSNEIRSHSLRRHAKRLHALAARARRRQTRVETLAHRVDSVADAMQVLTDHGEGFTTPRFSRLTGALGAPCAHAGGMLVATQTTGSWVSELSHAGDRHWATGTSSPCLSVFRPVAIGRPHASGSPTGKHDPHSLWWRHEGIHRAMRLTGWQPGASFHADRARTQAAILAAPDDGWLLAEDFLERWEGITRLPAACNTVPWWLARYWKSIDAQAAQEPARPWRARD